MATTEDMLVQIGNTTAFLSSQRDLGLQDDVVHTTMEAMAESLSLQIRCLKHIDLQAAAQLNASLTSSAFSQEQRLKIAKSISMRTVASSNTLAQKQPCTTQSLTNVCLYFSGHDLEQLQDERKSLGQLVQIVAARLSRLQLSNPSEQTHKHLACMLACMHWRTSYPTPAQAYSLMQDLKQAITSTRASQKQLHLPVYPASPQLLPADLFASAYAADDPPVAASLPRFHLMLGQMVCRSSNKQLRTQVAPTSQQATESPPSADAVAQALFRYGLRPHGWSEPSGLSGLQSMTYFTPPHAQSNDTRSPSLQSFTQAQSSQGTLAIQVAPMSSQHGFLSGTTIGNPHGERGP
eukprot:6491645-Amphidinium_carterae.1